jgi:uncharacterized protein YxeA
MSQNPQSKFICEPCHYLTSNKKDYNKHLATRKHQCSINSNNCNPINPQNEILTCLNCDKIYKSRVGLWRHKKICIKSENIKSENITLDIGISASSISDSSNNVIQLLINENKELINDNKDFKNMIIELVKTNNELQKQMVDVCQKIQPGNNNTINSHNKTFNLQVFLNEECKDAMNMSDFINSIEIKVSDLVNIGKLGYVEGMSNIIIKQLNDTDMYKRPVHCSDAKRETLYVKEENKWEKDTQETKQMLTAVWGVNKKNYTLLANWKETHPDCMSSKSNQSDEYMKITSKVMDGDLENINKVIKKVSKQVVIDK